MCHSKLRKQKWPFRSRLRDASCSERGALFLVSPVSRSRGWSIRQMCNWQEKHVGENKKNKPNSTTSLSHALTRRLCDPVTTEGNNQLLGFFFFLLPKLRDVTLTCIFLPFFFFYACIQPLDLPYIPTASYMSERLWKLCHNDDGLIFLPPFILAGFTWQLMASGIRQIDGLF